MQLLNHPTLRTPRIRPTNQQAESEDIKLTSLLSYPERGAYGSAKYRGNCAGNLLKDLFLWYKSIGKINHVVDPAEGSGTTGDVCRELNLTYTGLDLHSGFNLLRDRLRDHVNGRPDFCFFHPPYGNMVKYSGEMWGDTAHPDDLSQCTSPEDFLLKLQKCLINIYDVLADQGHYAILIGDQRKTGSYRSFQSDVIQMGVGRLANVLIKAQHNTQSARCEYFGHKFIPILHEYLLIFVKNRRIQSLGALAIEQEQRHERRQAGTWKMIVEDALAALGGRADLGSIYARVKETVYSSQNRHVEAKIRQTLQRHFTREDRGVYALPQAA